MACGVSCRADEVAELRVVDLHRVHEAEVHVGVDHEEAQHALEHVQGAADGLEELLRRLHLELRITLLDQHLVQR